MTALPIVLLACSANSVKSQYILAEKLWNDGNYAASVVEFEKVARRDPDGELGKNSLYRAAMTEAYFLSQYTDAIRKFRDYAEKSGEGPANWEAQKQIGEILFSKIEQYEQAIRHYQGMLSRRPDSAEGPEFMFRIAKSQFYLWQFDESVQTFEKLKKTFPQSVWAERAAYEIGVTHFTRAGGFRSADKKGQEAELYQDSIDVYERFIKQYPKSDLVPEAKFGIASCLEEMDQLEAAYHAFEALKSTYPSPQVIEVKLTRIRERKAQRSR